MLNTQQASIWITTKWLIYIGKNGRAGGGICIFIHESIDFKKRKDLSISKNGSEILSIEITNKAKIIFLSSVYWPSDSSLKEFKSSLKPIFDNVRRLDKELYLAGDFSINVLDHENNMKLKSVVNFAFQNSLITLINKPARATRTYATAIHHILTNVFLNKQIKTEIIETEISDHFPIFLFTDPITSSEIKNKRTLLNKRTINTATKENFKNILVRKTWDYIKEIDNPNEAYSKLLYDFSWLYEEAFPKLEIKIK